MRGYKTGSLCNLRILPDSTEANRSCNLPREHSCRRGRGDLPKERSHQADLGSRSLPREHSYQKGSRSLPKERSHRRGSRSLPRERTHPPRGRSFEAMLSSPMQITAEQACHCRTRMS